MLNKALFICFLLLAVFLRFFNLNNLPPSLNWDEVSLGYNAYSILKTGKDEWGESLPLSFRAYGEYKLPAYVYLDAPFIATFGLNEWGVRLPSTIMGIFTCVFLFLILKVLTKDVRVGLIGFFLVASAPWAIILSRIGLEANLALALTTGAVYFLLKEKPNLIISSLLLGLSIFAYNSSRIVSPLLLILAIIFFWRHFKNYKLKAVTALVVFFIFFSAAIPLAFLQDSSARYKLTAILDEGAINQINESRGASGLPQPIDIIVHNKATYFASSSFKNYLAHFNPGFLFLTGGSNYQFSVPGSPLLFPILLPFLIYGIWMAIKSKDKKWKFILFWLFLAPIPAAITRDSPHALRSLMMLPPVILLSGMGIDKVISLQYKFRFISTGIICAVILIFLAFFLKNYAMDYPKNYSWSWQYGYKQVVGYISKNGGNYNKIFITKKYGEPHEFLLFYNQINPNDYNNDKNLVRYPKSDWWWVDRFDKYYFLNDWEVKEKSVCDKNLEKCLLVTSPGNYPKETKPLQIVNFLDGAPAFEIVEF